MAVVFRLTREAFKDPDGNEGESKGFQYTFVRDSEHLVLDIQEPPPGTSRQYVISRTGGDHYSVRYAAGEKPVKAQSILVEAQLASLVAERMDASDLRPVLRFVLFGRPEPVTFRGSLPPGGLVTNDRWGKYRLATEPDPQAPGDTVVVVTLEKSGSEELAPVRIGDKVYQGKMDAPGEYWGQVFDNPKPVPNLKLTRWREELRLHYAPGRASPSRVAFTHEIEANNGKKHSREFRCEVLEHTTDAAAVNALMEKTRFKIKPGSGVLTVVDEDKAVQKMWSNGKAVDKVNSKVFEIGGTRFSRTRVIFLVALAVLVAGVVVFTLRARAPKAPGAAETPPTG
ncbi:MAG TPA: hypothetical protein VGE74_32590 [Gemmata sp.]